MSGSDDLSKRLELARSQQRDSEKVELHRESVASVKRPLRWNELLHTVKHHTRMTGGIYQDLKLTLEAPPDQNSLFVQRLAFPCASVTMRFLNERLITLDFTYQSNDMAPQIKWEDSIGFTTDALGNVQYEHKGNPLLDVDAAAYVVLLPLIDPRFSPPQEN